MSFDYNFDNRHNLSDKLCVCVALKQSKATRARACKVSPVAL